MHFGQLKRRKFIALLAGSGTVSPGTSFGQALDGRKRIGLLDYSGPDVERARLWDIFRQRLNELGYTEAPISHSCNAGRMEAPHSFKLLRQSSSI